MGLGSEQWVAAAVTASVAMLDVGIPMRDAYGLVPSFLAALLCSLAARSRSMRPPYVDGCPRPPSRGVFHAALGAALWALLAREIVTPTCSWQQGFLFFMNAACLSASAAFHGAETSTEREHDAFLFVDVVAAGLPMLAMLFTFRSSPRDVVGSLAFLGALTHASRREILLKRTDFEAARSLVVVVYFSYVEYAALMDPGTPHWFLGQFAAFATCFANLVLVDVRRKQRRMLLYLPHHSETWTAHEDAHVFLGVAQCFVYHRCVDKHALF
jgi:hypothetical protein